MNEDAEHWTETLFGIIPFHYLPFAWRRAVANTRGRYAPNTYEVKAAWHEIEAILKARKAKKLELQRKEKPWKFCNEKKYHIEGSRGEVLFYVREIDKNEIVPCRSCRRIEHDKKRRHFNALYGEIEPLNYAKSLFSGKQSARAAALATAADIIQSAIDEANRQCAKNVLKPEWQNYHDVWKTMLGAKKYIRFFDAREAVSMADVEEFLK